MPRGKSKKNKDVREKRSTSKRQRATTRKGAKTGSSAMDSGDVAGKPILVNEPSHGGRMTNEHHLSKEDSCTISRSTSSLGARHIKHAKILT